VHKGRELISGTSAIISKIVSLAGSRTPLSRAQPLGFDSPIDRRVYYPIYYQRHDVSIHKRLYQIVIRAEQVYNLLNFFLDLKTTKPSAVLWMPYTGHELTILNRNSACRYAKLKPSTVLLLDFYSHIQVTTLVEYPMQSEASLPSAPICPIRCWQPRSA
jgi:hypothetical protein